MLAQRVSTVKPFLVMEVLERAQELERKGKNVIHLEIGEPDFDTPAKIGEAAAQALHDGHTHYTHSLGDLELREAVAQWYARRYGVSVTPDRVLLFSGTSPAMMLLFQALLDPGDETILSDPGYACYANFVAFAGGKPVYVPTAEDDGFQFDPDEVLRHVTPRTRALLINSPCNPTGILLSPERMRRLAASGPLVVSDEIYHGLTYDDGPEHSILEFTDNAVVINGFSKAFAMTGWRLGYLIVPSRLVRPMQILMQNFFISPNAAVQRAALAALRCCEEDVRIMREEYDKRRKILLAGLKDLGFRIPVEPKGAFYMLVNARHLGSDSLQLAFEILEQVQVGVTPGIDFGSQAEGFLRFSYANSVENIQEALRRLGTFIASRK